MQPGTRALMRKVLPAGFMLLLLAGWAPGAFSASSPLQQGFMNRVTTMGAGHGAAGGVGESATVKGIADAGRRISDNVDFFGNGIPGFFGDWAAQNAFCTVSYLNLLTSLVLLLLVILVNRIIRLYINQKIRQVFLKNDRLAEIRSIWEALSKPLSLFILIYGTFLALAPVLVELRKTEGLSFAYLVAGKAADFAGYIAIFWFIYRLVNVMEAFLKKKVRTTETNLDDILVPLLGRTVRICIVIIGTAIVVKNLTGLDFGPLLASLGIGGMAVAFAAKDSIGNFLGSLTILFDKPFTVGDRIVIEGRDGVVEELGFRSTRIRTMAGSQVSIPNEKIINTTVENIGRRPNIRWMTTLCIASCTPPQKVEKAVEVVREILRDHECMQRDYPPRVFFNGFGEKCLTITVMAWYHSGNTWAYEEWVQQTCMRILKAYGEEQIELLGGK